jgi:outer membrane protein assembly factor BamB
MGPETDTRTAVSSARTPLRLWPGVMLAVLQCVLQFALPEILPDQGVYWFFGALVCALAIVVWWTFFSRAPWIERIGVPVLAIVALYLTSRVLHASVAQAGMGMLFVFSAVPLSCLAFVVAVTAGSRLARGPRLALIVAVILLASGGWALVRNEGIGGEGGLQLAWRWSATPEERLLARSAADPPRFDAPAIDASVEEAPSDAAGEGPPAARPQPTWPGFRGPRRDGVVLGARIDTDWATSPPVELWRRDVGPAWSSFAVDGDLLYTQEQRGDEETVASYRVATGEPVWRHVDATRFWEANSGAGPRGTPTIHEGRVLAFGANGILNVLDAATGARVWSRDVSSDTEVEVPYWGFASSPLVVGDLVVVAAAGRLAAYDLATGAPRWLGPAREGGYASPHALTLDGVEQILLIDGAGTIAVDPSDGSPLWEHAWPGPGMLQPARIGGGEILVTTAEMSGGAGLRRLAVARGPEGWTVEERWTSAGLKPYFNDIVVHEGHAYGFDGSILACIGLDDGERRWKGGRYGQGQLLLLPEQEVLLVLSERGELALVAAAPDAYVELARVPAIEGKTWNHPALAGDVLLVRNDREMAAFRLARKEAG